MVRYTGRQKIITGAVNTNQVGLKMSGCPSRVGRSGKNIRFLGRRVNCMYGLCGPTMVNGAPWRTSGRNFPPYCRQRSTACAQAAGGVGHINSPYTRTRVPAAGKQGCTEVIVGGAALSGIANTGSLRVTNEQQNSPPGPAAMYISAAMQVAAAFPSTLGSLNAITPANLREIYFIYFDTTSPAEFTILLKGNQLPGFTTLRVELGDTSTLDLLLTTTSISGSSSVGGLDYYQLTWDPIILGGGQEWVYGNTYNVTFL